MTFISSCTSLATEANQTKHKVVVIMGPTGSGKSRLSVDLATRFPGEIINSDKIQMYKGLDIITNKISLEDQQGIPHHLLSEFNSGSEHAEFTSTEFRARASQLIEHIVGRSKLPYIVGGSNSFIYALIAKNYSPDLGVLSSESGIIGTELRYDCCFLWVDVSPLVLEEYLRKRVDEMVELGIMDELARYYESEVHDTPPNTGLRKAIGVPEFEQYFKDSSTDASVREGLYEKALEALKENTCQLVKTQKKKILQLKGAGWDLHKLDGSNAFKALLAGLQNWRNVWEAEVVNVSVELVKRFVGEE